jgi:uncharacterized protein
MKNVMKFINMLLLALVLLVTPRIGGWFADLFDYSTIDPDGSFMWISIHHIAQALIILVLMIIMMKASKIKFHLGLGNKETGMKYLSKFIMIFTGYTVIAFIIIVLTNGFQSFQYPLTIRNITGYLGFQLLLSGPSEELIFRAFAISGFAYLVTDKRLNIKVSYAVLFASIIFGMAHMRFTFNPFSISYSLMQVVLSVALGYFYGDCYEKSKSVVYPMIMHSYSNVLMVGITIILSFIL